MAPVRRLACGGRLAAVGAAGSPACGSSRARRRGARSIAPLAAVAWGWLLAGPVRAAPPAGLRLEWVAPPACPQAAQVREMAAGVLGRPLDPGATPTTSVQARVTASARGFALTIETRSAGGTDVRRMQDARCSVLAEATAVIAATAVDPSLTPPPLRADPRGDLPPEPGAGLIPAPPVLPALPGTDAAAGPAGADELAPGTPGLSPGTGDMAPGTGASGLPPGTGDVSPGTGASGLSPGTANMSPGPGSAARPDAGGRAGPGAANLSEGPGRSGARLRGALRLAGVADLGSGPLGTGGLSVTGALLGARWRAELSGLWLAPRTARPDPTVDLGARISLFAAALRGCLTPKLGRTEVLACGGLEAGAVRGRGAGAQLGAAAAADTLPWLAVSVGPGLAYAPVPRLALTLQVDLVVPLLRPRFAVREGDGYRDLFRGGAAAGRVALGLEVRFR